MAIGGAFGAAKEKFCRIFGKKFKMSTIEWTLLAGQKA
jgi:hypothetical protein